MTSDRDRLARNDTSAPGFAESATEHYARLRAECPVSWQLGARSWLVVDHDSASKALRDPNIVHFGLQEAWDKLAKEYGQAFPLTMKVISYMPFVHEGVVHTALRRCYARALAPFANREEQFATRIDKLLEKPRRERRIDLARDFTSRVLFEVICDLAEIPESDRGVLQPLSRSSFVFESTLSLKRRKALEETLVRAEAVVLREIDRQIERSSESLIGMIHRELPEGETDRRSATAMVVFVILMMGNDPFNGALAFGLRNLLTARDGNGGPLVPQSAWASVADDLLRYGASVDFLVKRASRDMVLGEARIAAGDRVIVSPLSANHDAHAFGPAADTITQDHDNGVGLTFGGGLHICVGMRFSRTLARLALQALSELPPLRLDGPGRQGDGAVVRTMASLPAVFE